MQETGAGVESVEQPTGLLRRRGQRGGYCCRVAVVALEQVERRRLGAGRAETECGGSRPDGGRIEPVEAGPQPPPETERSWRQHVGHVGQVQAPAVRPEQRESLGLLLSPYRGMHAAVYGGVMSRTNVEIDDEILDRVRTTYGLRTKREAVDFALRRLLVQPMERAEALAMQGTGWDGDLDALRAGLGPRS